MATANHNLWPEEDRQKYYQAGYWQPCSLGKLLKTWAETYGDSTALIDNDGSLSYLDLDLKADRLAAGFHAQGIRSGDRVLVQLPNCNNFVAACFALFRIGALPILTMPAQRESDISALCKLAEPVAYLVADSFLGFDYLALAEKMQAQHSFLKQVIVDGNSDRFTSLASLEQTATEPSPTFSEPLFTDPALLLLSGGTTGTPKLIPRTHADYAYNARASAELCELNRDTVYLAALPIAHNFPLACPGILGTLGVGGTVVMAKTPGSDETFELIERHNVTITALVPPLVQLWLSAREWDNTDISSLQVLQVGGSRFEAELAKQVTPVLGCKLQQVFGMAEGLLCYTRLDDTDEVIINTQGRPLCPDDEIRIVDSEGNPVAQGEIGELHTKGPYTLRGYYRAAEHNAKTFTAEGFYQSGDLVRMTADGNIVVEGRIKEQINRAGEKIAVAEIEHLLNEHPNVDSSVLIPVPDARLGERSCAFIIEKATAEQPLTLQTIHQYLNDKGLPRYKLPDQLESLAVWPLTAVGKIDKKRLTALAANRDTDDSPAQQYLEHRLDVTSEPMELAMALAHSGLSDDYAIYEHNGEWSVGIGKYATVTADREQAYLNCDSADQPTQREAYRRDRLCTAITAATAQIPVKDWRAYGAAKFELSHIFYGIELGEQETAEELLALFIPRYEVRIQGDQALLRTLAAEQLETLTALVQKLDRQCAQQQAANGTPVVTDIQSHRQSEYKINVQKAVDEINSKHYQKVILSRRVPLPAEVDLTESYRVGRLQNTPARSFLVNYNGAQVAGFSPETVVEVSADGWVSTQPLAGTRALGANPQEEQQLREELLGDTKEIAEHAVSVKLAQEELTGVCDLSSIAVSEFMAIRRRGSVQHLASRVKGKLADDKNAWDAFEALFPAVTASGIPKKPAIEAIHRHEPEQRGWYSGCVMIVESDGAMDAALVLRSIYQQGEARWLQAGAGIVDQSKPERELQETVEKMSCLSQHLATRRPDAEKARQDNQAEAV